MRAERVWRESPTQASNKQPASKAGIFDSNNNGKCVMEIRRLQLFNKKSSGCCHEIGLASHDISYLTNLDQLGKNRLVHFVYTTPLAMHGRAEPAMYSVRLLERRKARIFKLEGDPILLKCGYLI